jgi:hypothetical protein
MKPACFSGLQGLGVLCLLALLPSMGLGSSRSFHDPSSLLEFNISKKEERKSTMEPPMVTESAPQEKAFSKAQQGSVPIPRAYLQATHI